MTDPTTTFEILSIEKASTGGGRAVERLTLVRMSILSDNGATMTDQNTVGAA